MSWTKVHDTNKTSATSGDFLNAVYTIPATTVGNVLTLIIQSGLTMSSTSVSGGGVATWIKAVSLGPSNFLSEIWYGVVTSATSNTSVTWVNSGNGNSITVSLVEFSWSGGAATAVTVEASTAGANTHTATGTAVSTGVITPTSGRDAVLICGWGRNGSATKTSGPTNSFTELTGATNATTAAYLLVSSTSGSYSAAWVYTNNYATHVAVICALSIGASAPSSKALFFAM